MTRQNRNQPELNDLTVDGEFPHQIAAPSEHDSKMHKQEPFVNEFGVVIGDSFYDSPNSPLNQWSTDTDPSVMAGDRWVHPTNDIGWNTTENRELLEDHTAKDERFMHPTKDVSYGRD
ncbi:DUF3905 domain-containing protein [Brevibacillus dissolubilis]|uniref:DUF3905 domain-containing protein n=1 Tax=Brevibacillus dissolubilis TaxID=1844116 RepID=UPI0011167764|nr:DUF3905 domain-containing protein [Brevibacillus dissolubilis]